MKRITFFSLLLMFVTAVGATGKIRITVQAGPYDRRDCVVSADVSALQPGPASSVVLYETTGGQKRPVPCQLISAQGEKPRLYWILDGPTNAGATRVFLAKKTKRKQTRPPIMDVADDQKALTLQKNGQNILRYNYTLVEPPPGVDPAYARSGFIHPAYSPKGNILTTIQPKDHYHHYGIWNPWTRILYDEKTYDLWNLREKQGTVRAKAIENVYRGDVFVGYTAPLDHFIFTPEEERVILNEWWEVKAWNVPEGFLWDFESHLHPATSLPVRIKEYRYAGFGYRATEEWTKDNCEMFSSEGETRQQIDGTKSRWVYITGDTPGGRSGLLFMGHPDNYNAPEPLYVWNKQANGGRGDAFINFVPTRDRDWELEPAHHYRLKYRVLSYEGEMTRERAEMLWQDFAHPPATLLEDRP